LESAPVESALRAALGAQYAVEREIGRGGMATVYLARDLRHRRQVAVKVLHPQLSAVLGPERFLKEIELTASLQHPHILPLFDSGNAEGLLYYVMPYVEGESLRAKLERERQLPVDEAVRLAREVASALAYAHGRAVIHRDVKPENVLVQGGHALVADFGIALAVQHAGGARMTQTGLSLGTPQYMAPEQAMGEKSVDARADLYSLATVLYEMLAGEPPFTGPTSQAIVARLMMEPPRSLRAQRPNVPPQVDAAVRTALEKLPADRFPTVTAFVAALEAPALAGQSLAYALSAADITVDPAVPRGVGTAVVRGTPRRVVLFAVGALIAAVALGWAARATRALPGSEREVVRFTIEPDTGTLAATTPAVSPDGRTVVYAARGADRTRLYARSVDALVPRPLPGTEDAEWAFFSPNGEWVGFYSNRAIRKVRLDGSTPVPIADVPSLAVFCGATWTPDDRILYIDQNGALYEVSASGGPITRVALADSTLHVWAARALPDTRALLVNVAESSDPGRIGVLDLESGRVNEFGDALGAHYIPGYILYANEDGELFRRPFDVGRLQPTGDPERIASNVGFAEGRLGRVGLGFAGLFPSFDAAPTGALVYRVAAIATEATQRLTIFDRTGREQRRFTARTPWAPRFSPGDLSVAYGAFAQGSAATDASDVWITDVAAGTTRRVTTDSNDNNDPHWSPGGREIVFSSLDTGSRKELRVQPVDGAEPRRLSLRGADLQPGTEWPSDWSRDGVWFTHVTPDGGMDLWVHPVVSDTAWPYLATAAREFGARLSPDGRWVAYTSNESGPNEVYVKPYPGPGAPRPVSVGGGHGPVWRRDGTELFFWQDGQLFAVPFELGGPRSGPRVNQTTRLFSVPYVENYHPNYDVSRDGKQFIVVTGPVVPNQLVVELNALTRADLRARAP
jgi:Tol biopolymer transport system component